jgi:hypothetical protein
MVSFYDVALDRKFSNESTTSVCFKFKFSAAVTQEKHPPEMVAAEQRNGIRGSAE